MAEIAALSFDAFARLEQRRSYLTDCTNAKKCASRIHFLTLVFAYPIPF